MSSAGGSSVFGVGFGSTGAGSDCSEVSFGAGSSVFGSVGAGLSSGVVSFADSVSSVFGSVLAGGGSEGFGSV